MQDDCNYNFYRYIPCCWDLCSTKVNISLLEFKHHKGSGYFVKYPTGNNVYFTCLTPDGPVLTLEFLRHLFSISLKQPHWSNGGSRTGGPKASRREHHFLLINTRYFGPPKLPLKPPPLATMKAAGIRLIGRA